MNLIPRIETYFLLSGLAASGILGPRIYHTNRTTIVRGLSTARHSTRGLARN
jgi:hypothetical protein